MLPIPPTLKILRLVRLVRLLKLLRILKASKMLARYETELSISNRAISIFSITLSIFVVSHWVACLWALTGRLGQGDEGEGYSWIDAIEENKPGPCVARCRRRCALRDSPPPPPPGTTTSSAFTSPRCTSPSW